MPRRLVRTVIRHAANPAVPAIDPRAMTLVAVGLFFAVRSMLALELERQA
jgi:hypothetical protein